MNGDFSLGTDPGLRTGAGCGPAVELARHGLGSQKEKDQSEGCLQDQARASDSLALGGRVSVHIAPSANPGGGTGNHGNEGLEKPGKKSPSVVLPWPMAQVFLPGCLEPG